jgi:DNA-binding phage protein
MNLRSTSGLDTVSISGTKEARSSSSSVAARKRSKRKTSPRQKSDGPIIGAEYGKDGRILSLPYVDIVIARMKREPEFATGILCEAIDALIAGELGVSKIMLRNYVNGTLGFEKLAKKTRLPIKSLMRMLGPSGNPQMTNLFAVIGALQKHAGIALHVAAE